MRTLLLATATTVALGLAAPQILLSEDGKYPEGRQTYEAEMHEKIVNRQKSLDEIDLSAEAEEAWDEVQQSWAALTEAADENWEAAKDSFEENWDAFQETLADLEGGNS